MILKKGQKLVKAQKKQQREEERRLREEGDSEVSGYLKKYWALSGNSRPAKVHCVNSRVLFNPTEEARLQAEREEQERLERDRKQREVEKLESKVVPS